MITNVSFLSDDVTGSTPVSNASLRLLMVSLGLLINVFCLL